MALAFVQSKNNGSKNNNTVVITPSVAITVGNFIVVAIITTQGTVSSVTDSSAQSWSQAATKANGSINGYIYYFENSAAITSITITTSTSTGETNAAFHEWSGVLTSSSLDKIASNSGTGTALDSGSTATTAQANELLIGGGGQAAGGPTLTLGAGYENLSQQGFDVGTAGIEDQVVSSTGTYNATFTSSKNQDWVMLISTFKAAAAITTSTSSTSTSTSRSTSTSSTSTSISSTSSSTSSTSVSTSISTSSTSTSISTSTSSSTSISSTSTSISTSSTSTSTSTSTSFSTSSTSTSTSISTSTSTSFSTSSTSTSMSTSTTIITNDIPVVTIHDRVRSL